jgi:hypothetical protein
MTASFSAQTTQSRGFAGGHCTRGIVWRAEVDEINPLAGHLGHESILRGARQIEEPAVDTRFVRRAGVAGHDVGVDVNRIDRIHHRDPVVVAENVEDVRTVAFRTVRNKIIVSDLDGADR